MHRDHRAKVFWTGRSQAVRLPKEFRFEGTEVRIRKEGDAVILEPVEKPSWPAGFWERLASLPQSTADFVRPEPLAESPHRDAVLEKIDEE